MSDGPAAEAQQIVELAGPPCSRQPTPGWSFTPSTEIPDLPLPFERLLCSEEDCPKPFQLKTICMSHGMRLEL